MLKAFLLIPSLILYSLYLQIPPDPTTKKLKMKYDKTKELEKERNGLKTSMLGYKDLFHKYYAKNQPLEQTLVTIRKQHRRMDRALMEHADSG